MPHLPILNINLYYEVHGHGPPLLFIHGLGSSTRDWEPQIDFFSKHYQVITFDIRGHGKSDKPSGPYSIPLFAADAAELIKSLDIAPSHIVGISLGGMIAFQLAVDAPDLVKSLVIVNSTPEFVGRKFKERLAVLQRVLTVRLLGMRILGQFLSRRIFPRPEYKEFRKVLVERWSQNDKRAYLDSFKAIVGWSVTDRLGAIGCPSLVIAAEGDYTPISFKKAYVAKMPQAELMVVKDSGHLTPVDQPEQFNEALLAFLMKYTLTTNE